MIKFSLFFLNAIKIEVNKKNPPIGNAEGKKKIPIKKSFSPKFNSLLNILFKLNLSDILYTFIVGKTDSVKKLSLSYHDFRICVEIPILAKMQKLKYLSTPSKERKRIGGTKKVNALKDGFLILIAIVNFFLKKSFKIT